MVITPEMFGQLLFSVIIAAAAAAAGATMLFHSFVDIVFDLVRWLQVRYFPDRLLKNRLRLLALRARYRALRAARKAAP